MFAVLVALGRTFVVSVCVSLLEWRKSALIGAIKYVTFRIPFCHPVEVNNAPVVVWDLLLWVYLCFTPFWWSVLLHSADISVSWRPIIADELS